MKKLFLLTVLALAPLVQSCQTTETIVSSPYTLDKNKTKVFTAKTFMFKNYYFTYKDGKATLVYQQDTRLNGAQTPIFLTLEEDQNSKRHQLFVDSSGQISVRVINNAQVKLRLDKVTYTLYTENYLDEVHPDTEKILADVAIWRKDNY
ncbi:hypothetical protein HX004_11470 [Myroides sp. 1354]|uniref:hypothetical protein n=1 Tax=unclassified Myroides TaxID=2642485 RepID=UPI00257691F6|nr:MULTISPECIES: hypothetical protein [unclassified Myroides]MDM1045372.1 hypothetical protein [Myroides sp. R163-1]MDM1056391.1 hypothetical protein [Myroides sp. 1354]MDM1069503.1 hypothetical protein [Myroides sp. 1372]